MGIRCLILLMVLIVSNSAFAQMYANSIVQVDDGKSNGFVGIAKTKLDYETKSDFEVERMVIYGGMDYGLGKDVDLVIQAGFIVDSEYESNADLEGSGFMFGAGARTKFYREGRMSASAHAFLNYLSEELEGKYTFLGVPVDATVETSLMEVHLGATIGFAASPTFTLFGGLELVPISDGEVEVKAKAGVANDSADANVERDNIVNLRLGAVLSPGRVNISPYLIFAGETTFGAAASFAF